MFAQCEDEYSFFNEEKRSFERGWGNVTEKASNASSVDRAFGYQSSEQLDTNQWVAGNHHTYGSGGYVYDFRGRLQDLKSNLSQLHRANWIDGQTRAVIVQFTLYSPNVQLFTSVILLAEFLATGGIETQSSFQPISFQSNHLCPHLTNSLSLHDAVFTSLTHLIASILYLVLIVHMMMVEVQSLIKLKRAYFRQFWSYIDVGIIACSWTSVGIYVWRYRELNRIGDLFAQTHGYAYVNLQQAVYVNEVFSCLIASACFFATIKFIRLGRFNHRLMFFVQTLSHAGRDLLSFVSMFSVVFWAFITLFYLLFVGKLLTCSTLLHTAQMLFEMTLMKFDAHQLSEAAPFLGPLVFSLFILVVVFVCMSMFLTIINESFRDVREQASAHPDRDQHIFSFMLDRLQRSVGLGRSEEWRRQAEYDEQMRSEYLDPIEHFPDKMDQLLDALNRVRILFSIFVSFYCVSFAGVYGSASATQTSLMNSYNYLAYCAHTLLDVLLNKCLLFSSVRC